MQQSASDVDMTDEQHAARHMLPTDISVVMRHVPEALLSQMRGDYARISQSMLKLRWSPAGREGTLGGGGVHSVQSHPSLSQPYRRVESN